MPFIPTDENTFEEAVLKGITFGGLGLASLYGLNELKEYLADKLNIAPQVYSKEVKYVGVPYPVAIEKKAGAVNNFGFGFGLPIGSFLTYKLIDYLTTQNNALETRNLIRQLEQNERLAEVPREFVPSTVSVYNIEEEKMAADEEIDKFIQINVFQKTANGKTKPNYDDDQTTKEVVHFLTTDLLTKYLPIFYGSLVPVGLLAGYYGIKSISENSEMPDMEYVDPLEKQPTLRANFVSPDDKKTPTIMGAFNKKQVELSRLKKESIYREEPKLDTTKTSNALILAGLGTIASSLTGSPEKKEEPESLPPSEHMFSVDKVKAEKPSEWSFTQKAGT